MVTLKILFMKALLVTRMVLELFFFSKTVVCDFIVISSCAKLGHGTAVVLHTTNSTSSQIYHHFRITIKVFLYLINLV